MKKKKKEKNTKQHFVPKSYLKAWIDPDIPRNINGQNIWIFDRNGQNPKQKSPRSTFTEDEMYTLTASDGERDLRLENGLGTIESRFGSIRTSKLNNRRPLTSEEWYWICLFAATLHLRTANTRDNMLKGFEKLKAMTVDKFPPNWEEMKVSEEPQNPDFYYPVPSDFDNLKQNITQSLIENAASYLAPRLASMNAVILCTKHPIGFITTDAPSTWIDPESYNRHPLRSSAGLKNINVEITLPLSPNQCLLLSHHDLGDDLYRDVSDDVVNTLNHRHIAHAPDSIVASKSELDPLWLEQLPDQPDSSDTLDTAGDYAVD